VYCVLSDKEDRLVTGHHSTVNRCEKKKINILWTRN